MESTFGSGGLPFSGLYPSFHMGTFGERPGWPRTLPPKVYHQWPSITPTARGLPLLPRLSGGIDRRMPTQWLRNHVM